MNSPQDKEKKSIYFEEDVICVWSPTRPKRLKRINGAMISGASRIGRLSERKDAKEEEAEERKEGRARTDGRSAQGGIPPCIKTLSDDSI